MAGTTAAGSPAATLAQVARSLGDPSRADMCMALLDGREWRIGDLAGVAGVGASTATEHVACLEAAGIVAIRREGRCAYVTLGSPVVAEVVELLASLGTGPGGTGTGAATQRSSLRAVGERRRLRQARTCYDHLAGSLGVAVYAALLGRGVIRRRRGLAVPDHARDWWAELGVDLDALDRQRRPLLRECTDWTERAPHLAGGLGAAVCDLAFANSWVRRADATRRVVVTPKGREALGRALGVGYAGTSDSWSANWVV